MLYLQMHEDTVQVSHESLELQELQDVFYGTQIPGKTYVGCLIDHSTVHAACVCL